MPHGNARRPTAEDIANTAAASPHHAGARRFGGGAIAAGAGLLLIVLAGIYLATRHTPPAPEPVPAAATYVGAKTCATCHESQANAWRGSDHALSMQVARPGTVLGNFDNAQFIHAGIASRFWQRDDRYMVTTEGPDGRVGDFEIKYTFGVRPLQQYLVELPGGRLQALGIAWDARARAAGGQRWFHLYPRDTPKAGDALHWTGVNQNWNYMCAECHSTDLRKNYDSTTETFKTAWAEINVACEACHGPGSTHLDWARGDVALRARNPGKGLVNPLDQRKGVVWTPSTEQSPPRRHPPARGAGEFDTCSRCHARATRIAGEYAHDRPLLDSRRPALLSEGLYWNDGQQRDEVFTWGSFVQSRMHAQGVTCSDCHEPHSLKLRVDGNALCAQCHNAQRYDATTHHHHAPESAGARCSACHMPTTTYMLVDPRHDHSLRLPRPDLSEKFGVSNLPNACNRCHDKQSARWASDALRRWSGKAPAGVPAQVEAFFAAQADEPRARKLLEAIIDDESLPTITRASAIERLAAPLSSVNIDALVRRLNAEDPLLRLASVEALATLPAEQRRRHLARMLGDSLLAVRTAAARALAGAAEGGFTPAERSAFDTSLRDYLGTLAYNADRPEVQMNWGNLLAARGDVSGAATHYRQSIKLDRGFVEGYVNLADLYRQRGADGEREAEAVLRQGLTSVPAAGPIAQAAPLHYALGLSLVRQRRNGEALASLAEAARRDPAQVRYAYVHAIALHDSGASEKALQVLQAALTRKPNDADLLTALAQYSAHAGRHDAALKYVGRLQALDPENPEYQKLASQIKAAPPGRTRP